VLTTTVATGRVAIRAPEVLLSADLSVPESPVGAVLYAHAGPSDLDPRTPEITGALNDAGFATLALDLLPDEAALEEPLRFDVTLLADRLRAAMHWLRGHELGRLPLGCLGAGTAAQAALSAAAAPELGVRAVVALGGWPNLVPVPVLRRVQAPTLLVVGGVDGHVLELNRSALAQLSSCEHELAVIPGATHNFEQFGALEQVDELATAWFARHLAPEES
jgi:putative phosphoribosyl transferase